MVHQGATLSVWKFSSERYCEKASCIHCQLLRRALLTRMNVHLYFLSNVQLRDVQVKRKSFCILQIQYLTLLLFKISTVNKWGTVFCGIPKWSLIIKLRTSVSAAKNREQNLFYRSRRSLVACKFWSRWLKWTQIITSCWHCDLHVCYSSTRKKQKQTKKNLHNYTSVFLCVIKSFWQKRPCDFKVFWKGKNETALWIY